MGRVTLLTDFGTADGYAAAMAGVIAAACPGVIVDHASHDVAPGDIPGAALALARYAWLYPPGTVHVVVVDPGVGTDRRAIAARAGDRLFVAPDNGVLTRVLATEPDAVVVELAPPDAHASATFHGRDVFAPAAARLAAGESIDRVGSGVGDPVRLEIPTPDADLEGGEIRGVVVEVDRFGNLVSNVPADAARALPGDGPLHVFIEQDPVGPVRGTYGDVEDGGLVAVVGSLDTVEVSVRNGSAADRLGAGRGARVTVRRSGPPAPG
jgi:S-adenosylmethionine hydrolase